MATRTRRRYPKPSSVRITVHITPEQDEAKWGEIATTMQAIPETLGQIRAYLWKEDLARAENAAWSLIGQAQRIQAQINFLYAARSLGVSEPMEMTVEEILEREG